MELPAMNSDKFWGISAFLIGTWEFVAYKTHKIPTVTKISHMAKKRYGHKAESVIVLWGLMLIKHLLSYKT